MGIYTCYTPGYTTILWEKPLRRYLSSLLFFGRNLCAETSPLSLFV